VSGPGALSGPPIFIDWKIKKGSAEAGPFSISKRLSDLPAATLPAELGKRVGILLLEKVLKLHVTPVTGSEVVSISFSESSHERIAVLLTNFAVLVTLTAVKASVVAHWCDPSC
jgi:hypothetical protein